MIEITNLYTMLGMVDEKHFKWAMANYLRIYPQTIIESYGEKKMVHGRKKGVTMNYCEIMVEINGRNKRAADLTNLHEYLENGWKFKQDDELYKTIARLYRYYYDRANDHRPG
jgi:hypothetical protein